jgi:hypothetical protein
VAAKKKPIYVDSDDEDEDMSGDLEESAVIDDASDDYDD